MKKKKLTKVTIDTEEVYYAEQVKNLVMTELSIGRDVYYDYHVPLMKANNLFFYPSKKAKMRGIDLYHYLQQAVKQHEPLKKYR